MNELIADFEAFCSESRLIDNADTKMRVVLSGATFEQNIKYNIYYAPKDRSFQTHKYLGLYMDKAVQAIGEIIGYADFTYNSKSEKLVASETHLIKPTDKQKAMIIDIIKEAKEIFNFDISKSHRFFSIQKYYLTEFIKPTKGGLMGQKYFDFTDIKGYAKNMSTEKIAELLRNKEWQY